jgi:iron complex transport system ATP-binding protein
MIVVKNLSYSALGRKILNDVSCTFHDKQITGLIGANGSGKTTLLRHIYRALPSQNSVFLDDIPIESFTPREYAKKIAALLQEFRIPAEFSVTDIVIMGRYAYKKWSETYDNQDNAVVASALKFVELEGMKNRLFSSLSGGEKQRVLLARAFCQEAPILILDEPANHLDIRQQMGLMKILARRKQTAVAALHDLNLAAMYCDRLIIISDGKIMGCGSPMEILTERNIFRFFGVRAYVNSKSTKYPVINFAKL